MYRSHFSSLLLVVFGGISAACSVVKAWTVGGVLHPTRPARWCLTGKYRRPLSSLHLFFRATTKVVNHALPPFVFQDLSSDNITLPYSITLPPDYDDYNAQDVTKELIVRPLEWEDIKAVTDMCVKEYGDDTETFSSNVLSLEFWKGWSEYFELRNVVDITMRLKAMGEIDRQGIPLDHAVLLACFCCKTNDEVELDTIVGMVELSQQPRLPERNPPPFPVPLLLKQLFFEGTLQGWITNLLITPEHRGRGYSKVLLAACDGIARKWKCQSISLHCEANAVTGKIPQRLYAKSGYHPLEGVGSSNADYSWITQAGAVSGGPATALQSSVFVLDDVPLLYLQKKLD